MQFKFNVKLDLPYTNVSIPGSPKLGPLYLNTYLHAPWFVNRKTSGAEFTSAYVTSNSPWSFLNRCRRRSVRSFLRITRFRLHLDSYHFLAFILALIATEVQSHRLLHGFWYRGLRLRARSILFYLGLTAFRVTVKSLRLVRFPATFARFRSTLRRGGSEHLQFVLNDGL